MTDQAGTVTFSYDILGRQSSETRTLTGANNAVISKTLSYDYNLDGSLKALHYPSGAIITYTPDSAGRTLSAVDTANSINYATSATYGPDGGLTGFISGSGGPASITNSFSYNKRLQPCRMAAGTSGLPANCADTSTHGNVFDITYDFHVGSSNNGNVYGTLNNRDHSRDQTFTYDSLNRLITAQNAGTNCAATVNGKTEYWGNSYSYDAWGNLLGKSVTKCGAENLVVTADAHNWIHASGTDYQYDAAGNMTFNATAPAQAYTFDQENRLTGASGYAYTYDGDGNRVRKSNGNTASSGTLYWYMAPGVVAESDLAGTLKSEYVFFDGERVARKDFPGNTVAYYFSDHLNTASVITNASGTITSESDYYPWGGELQFLNNDSNDYKFTGKKRDTETGLDYFGARYYSNGLSRFLTPDWSAGPTPVPYADIFDPQSLNLYAYVGGNPTTRIDGVGHQQSQVPIGINVGIYWKNGVDAGIETHNNPRQAGRDALQSVGAFIQSIFNLLPYGDNKPHPHYQAPVGIQAPNSAVGRATTTVLVIASLFVPAPKAAPIVDLTNTVRAPSVIAKAQEALDLAVSTRSGNPGAMAAGFDTTTGNVAIGTSRNVPQIGEINPQLGQAAESVGG
jgi:RHS repeat-associated protein